MTIQITIIGLRQIGASIGLALKDHQELVKRVGHDREATIARQAEKMGAVDSISFNLPASVRQADLVILTEPFDEMQETLKIIASELRGGAVIMDTAPVKQDYSSWVMGILPADRHYVSLMPALNPAYLNDTAEGQESARGDLFHNSLILITQPSGTNAEAIKLASDLTSLLGATPLFADAAEVDGLVAAGIFLPQLAAAALLNATTDQPGWREGRKIAGPDFTKATAPILNLTETKDLGQAILFNRENTLRMIDTLIDSLGDLRQAIAQQDQPAIQELLENALKGRELWWKQRLAANWAALENPQPRTPGAGEMIGRLIGIRQKQSKDGK